MPPSSSPIQFSQRIPAVSLDLIVDAMAHEKGREKIKTIIHEYVNSVPFEELVMKYAGKEIERRSLGTLKYWSILILTTIVTGIITSVITIIVAKHVQ